MVTFHPSYTKARSPAGFLVFRPSVLIRNARGQHAGCRISASVAFDTAEGARNFARRKAHEVAERFTFVRVS